MEPKQDGSQPSSDRQKWQKVFDAVVGIIAKQQSQLQSLVKERELLGDRIRTQQKLHDFDVTFLRDQISQMKGALAVQDMVHSLDARKLELAVGLKQREVLLHRLKLDEAEPELADFKECFNILSAKCPNPEDDSRQNTSVTSRSKKLHGESGQESAEELLSHNHALEDEIKRLKHELGSLVSEKDAEMSALMAEKNFVWNQFRIMETNLNNKLKSKEAEARLANEKISGLLASIEKLQSSNDDKDEVIARLKSEAASMEAIARKKDDDIMILVHELELLRGRRCTSETPTLRRCTSPGSTGSPLRNKDANVIVNRQPAFARVSDSTKNSKKGSRSSKRKADDGDSFQPTPKLFSSSFKVPKLKTPPNEMR